MAAMWNGMLDLLFPNRAAVEPSGPWRPFVNPAEKKDTNFLSKVVEKWMLGRSSPESREWQLLKDRVSALEQAVNQRAARRARPVKIYPTTRSSIPS